MDSHFQTPTRSGMSYMGMQILYNILNRNEKIYCERIFAPAEDMEALMREEGRKLFTLETFTSVDELDIVGLPCSMSCHTQMC